MLSISARRSLGKPPGSKPEPIILNLPFEIRELIYEYTRDDSFYELYHADFHENQQPMSIFGDFLDDYRIQTIDARRLQAISPHELQDKRSRSRYYVRHNGRVALLRVCKQTYREYRLIFLGCTKFYATCDHSADRIATLLPKTWLPFIKEFVGSFARLDAITPSVFPKLERVEIFDFGSIPKDFDNHYTLDEFLNTSPNDLIDTVLQESGNQTLQARERRVRDMLPIIQRLSPQVDFIIHANCRLRDRIGPGEAPTGRFDDFWVYYSLRFSTRDRVLDVRLSRMVALAGSTVHNVNPTKPLLEKWDPNNTWPGTSRGNLRSRLTMGLLSQKDPVHRPFSFL